MKYLSLVLGLMLSSLFVYGQYIPDSVKTRSAAEIEQRNETTGGEEALILHSNGDIEMGDYTSLRPFSIFPKNFSAWDNDGIMQKYEIQDLIDTILDQDLLTPDGVVPSNSDTARRIGVTWQHNNPILFTRATTGGYFGIVKPIQAGSLSPNWLFTMNTTDNAGSDRDNFTVGMGFNIHAGGGAERAGMSGIGLSFEDHYEPTAGDSIAEYHTLFVDGTGAQNRLESYTIRKANKDFWENYYTLGKTYWKDPNNGNQWLIFNRGNTSTVQMAMLGSASGTGVQFYMDAGQTLLDISPSGMAGPYRSISMDQFDVFALPTINGIEYNVNQNYTYHRNGAFVSANDNMAALGDISNRFNNVWATSIHTTLAGDNSDNIFTVDGSGEIRISKFPNTRDDGTPVNVLGTNSTGLLQSYPISGLPQLYNPELTPETVSFSTASANNLYLIDLTGDSTVTVNVTDQIIGKPYKYIGYNSTTGAIDFSVSVGSTFQNNGTNSVDGIVGNFTYKVIRLSSTLYIVTLEAYTLE